MINVRLHKAILHYKYHTIQYNIISLMSDYIRQYYIINVTLHKTILYHCCHNTQGNIPSLLEYTRQCHTTEDNITLLMSDNTRQYYIINVGLHKAI